eukprot:jgi/Botrbrau1/7968/Bobra.9_2s0119.2
MLMMPTRPPYALTSMISPKLRFALGFIVSLSLKPVCIEAGQEAQGTSSLDDILYQNFGNLTSDPSSIFYFITTQLNHANLNDTMPTISLFQHLPPWRAAQLRPCLKKDIGTCLWHGNSSNGLPERLQGIYWQDGLGQQLRAQKAIAEGERTREGCKGEEAERA